MDNIRSSILKLDLEIFKTSHSREEAWYLTFLLLSKDLKIIKWKIRHKMLLLLQRQAIALTGQKCLDLKVELLMIYMHRIVQPSNKYLKQVMIPDFNQKSIQFCSVMRI